MLYKKEQVVCNRTTPQAGPYSKGIVAGPLVFVAGQRGYDVEQKKMGKDIKEQTRLCLVNIGKILEDAGSSLTSVVKCNVYLADLNDFDAMNEVYKEFMPAPCPVRTTVGCMLRNMLVEIDVIALKEDCK